MRASFLKEQEYQMNILGNNFSSCPPEEYTRIYITGEIVSASDFIAEQIYISYTVKLPQSMSFQIPEQIKQLAPTQQELQQFNCQESITQSASAIISNSQNGNESYTFNFSFPIDLQIILIDSKRDQKVPTIYFQVFSIDSWDRTVMIGCGFVSVPIQPGCHQMNVSTWRPTAGLRSKVSEFFLGGANKVKNIYQISNHQLTTQTNHKAPQNRILTHTENGGDVLFRLNVAAQSKQLKSDARKHAKIKNIAQLVQIQKQKKPPMQISPFINTGHGYTGRYTNTRL